MLKNKSTVSQLYDQITTDGATSGYVELATEHASNEWTAGDRIMVLLDVATLFAGNTEDIVVDLVIRD
jgi:hypothetical protein